MKVRMTFVPEHYVVLEKSPFNDLIKAVKGFRKLSTLYKDLLILINDVDLVSDSSRYPIIGKALEIVNALYPFEKTKTDQRIQKYFPEIEPFFNGVTIRRLQELSNTRRESRHYIANKSELTPHKMMTYEELKEYYFCSNLLCINVIRKELGLSSFIIQNDL